MKIVVSFLVLVVSFAQASSIVKETDNVLSISLSNKVEARTNESMELESGPYSFENCSTLATDMAFYGAMTCISRGRVNAGCVFTRDYQIGNLNSLWDQFCASPSATPSTSPDASFPVYICQCIEYETLKPNIICLNDMVASTDSEGLVIVKGDASFETGFSIGTIDSSVNDTMLIVGGNLQFLGGAVVGQIEVVGNAVVGSSITNGGATVSSGSTFDFDGSVPHFIGVTDRLCNLGDTGTVIREGVVLTALRGNAATEVFTLTSLNLENATTLDLSGISASATVVINVKDVVVDFSLNVITPNGPNVVYNFCNAQSLSLNKILIDGSVIAPRAHIAGVGGVVKGQVVAGSYSGSTQFNNVECTACL